MKKLKKIFIGIVVAFAVLFGAAFISAIIDVAKNPNDYTTTLEEKTTEAISESTKVLGDSVQTTTGTLEESIITNSTNDSPITTDVTVVESSKSTTKPNTTVASTNSNAKVDLSKIPDFANKPYVTVNNNQPGFTASDKTTNSFERYSSLDSKGRCGVAYACIGKDIMPTDERGAIGSIKPSGWHTVKYAGIDGNYLYNRCHLIGWQLSGENANEKNLITGTRYMNVEGMLPFENMVADYVKETGNHVLYRVTPVFKGNNLLVSGVQIEAYSVEDNGEGICFNVYCYNVQPGITINYADGSSSGPPMEQTTKKPSTTQKPSVTQQTNGGDVASDVDYVINTNTGKFHKPSCSSVKDIKSHNREDFKGDRQTVIDRGYEPCGRCHP